jgi:hypothetical protein
LSGELDDAGLRLMVANVAIEERAGQSKAFNGKNCDS